MKRRAVVPGRRQPDAGLTLVEMMVVLAMVAVLSGAGLGLAGQVSGQRLGQAGDLLAARLSLAADEALVTGRPVRLEFSAEGYRFTTRMADGEWTPLPSGPLAHPVALPVKVTGQDGADLHEVDVPADGTGTVRQIILQRNGARVTIRFDGLSAEVVTADADDADA